MENKDAVDILKGLKDQGIRFTPQRQAILEYLLATDTHPTAEEVFHQVKERFPGVSLGTIYNTLNMLRDHGFILELSCGEVCSRYDGNNSLHDHVVCTHCGKVVDLYTYNEEPDLAAAAKTGFQVSSHQMMFYGICPQCQVVH